MLAAACLPPGAKSRDTAMPPSVAWAEEATSNWQSVAAVLTASIVRDPSARARPIRCALAVAGCGSHFMSKMTAAALNCPK